eukprot:CAMPEP_0202898092 /NCGR_PEP_ID=MMETSP1392-20130828/6700_1 /ASSEMBLY_ACC=CAM_ASM_000868 /TAXON_ID=225041 /ORGANISM="Chlamydomonas chlamydogama, Strain SAG 11-48b" /LENGTH=525 /DNA_ID=CAMNT_0049583925 /DNA_START=105 /DNA_END=1682 /DNA_ORIENTATION=-
MFRHACVLLGLLMCLPLGCQSQNACSATQPISSGGVPVAPGAYVSRSPSATLRLYNASTSTILMRMSFPSYTQYFRGTQTYNASTAQAGWSLAYQVSSKRDSFGWAQSATGDVLYFADALSNAVLPGPAFNSTSLTGLYVFAVQTPAVWNNASALHTLWATRVPNGEDAEGSPVLLASGHLMVPYKDSNDSAYKVHVVNATSGELLSASRPFNLASLQPPSRFWWPNTGADATDFGQLAVFPTRPLTANVSQQENGTLVALRVSAAGLPQLAWNATQGGELLSVVAMDTAVIVASPDQLWTVTTQGNVTVSSYAYQAADAATIVVSRVLGTLYVPAAASDSDNPLYQTLSILLFTLGPGGSLVPALSSITLPSSVEDILGMSVTQDTTCPALVITVRSQGGSMRLLRYPLSSSGPTAFDTQLPGSSSSILSAPILLPLIPTSILLTMYVSPADAPALGIPPSSQALWQVKLGIAPPSPPDTPSLPPRPPLPPSPPLPKGAGAAELQAWMLLVFCTLAAIMQRVAV